MEQIIGPLISSDANYTAGVFNGRVVDMSNLIIDGNLKVLGSTTLGPANISVTTIIQNITANTLTATNFSSNILTVSIGVINVATLGSSFISFLTVNNIQSTSAVIGNCVATSATFVNLSITTYLDIQGTTLLTGTNTISGPVIIDGITTIMNSQNSQDLKMGSFVSDISLRGLDVSLNATTLSLNSELMYIDTEYLILNVGSIDLGSLTVSTLLGPAINSKVYLFNDLTTGTVYINAKNNTIGDPSELGINLFSGTNQVNNAVIGQILAMSSNSHASLYSNLSTGTLSIGAKNIFIGTSSSIGIYTETNIFSALSTDIISTTNAGAYVSLFSNLTTGTLSIGAKNIYAYDIGLNIFYSSNFIPLGLGVNLIVSSATNSHASLYSNLSTGTLTINAKNNIYNSLGSKIFTGSNTFLSDLSTNNIFTTATSSNANLYSNLATGTLTIGAKNIVFGTVNGITTFNGTNKFNKVITNRINGLMQLYSNLIIGSVTIGSKNIEIGEPTAGSVIFSSNLSLVLFSNLTSNLSSNQIISSGSTDNVSMFSNLSSGTLIIGPNRLVLGTSNPTNIFNGTSIFGFVNVGGIIGTTSFANVNVYSDLTAGTLTIGAKNILLGSLTSKITNFGTHFFNNGLVGDIIIGTAANALANVYTSLSIGTVFIGARNISIGTVGGFNFLVGTNIVPAINTNVIVTTNPSENVSLYSTINTGTVYIGANNILIGTNVGINTLFGTNIFTNISSNLITATATNSSASLYSNLTAGTLTIGARNIYFGTPDGYNLFVGTYTIGALSANTLTAPSSSSNVNMFTNLSTGTVTIGAKNIAFSDSSGEKIFYGTTFIPAVIVSSSILVNLGSGIIVNLYSNITTGTLTIGAKNIIVGTNPMNTINWFTGTNVFRDLVSTNIIATTAANMSASLFSNLTTGTLTIGAANIIIGTPIGITTFLGSTYFRSISTNVIVATAVNSNVQFFDNLESGSSLTFGASTILFGTVDGLNSFRIFNSFPLILVTNLISAENTSLSSSLYASLSTGTVIIGSKNISVGTPDGINLFFGSNIFNNVYSNLFASTSASALINIYLSSPTITIGMYPLKLIFANTITQLSKLYSNIYGETTDSDVKVFQQENYINVGTFPNIPISNVTNASTHSSIKLTGENITVMSAVSSTAFLTSFTNQLDSPINYLPGSNISWVSNTLIGNSVLWYAIAVDEYNGVAIAAGTNTATPIMTSVDGLTWTLRTPPANTSEFRSAVVGYINGLTSTPAYILGGITGSSYRILRSTDFGVTWVSISGTIGSRWFGLCWSNSLKRFCAIGDSVSATMISNDYGVTWVSNALSLSGAWRDLCFSEELGLFVGVGAITGPTNRSLYSTDGISWITSLTNTNTQCTKVTWGVFDTNIEGAIGAFIAPAAATPPFNVTSSTFNVSYNGISWFTIFPGTSSRWGTVCYNKNSKVFNAINLYSQGTPLNIYSYNALTWFTGSPITNNSYTGIAWAGFLNRYIAVANTGTFRHILSANRSWSGITYSPELDRFCISGGGTFLDNILYSSGTGPNLTWYNSIKPTTRNLSDITWSSTLGIFVAVGDNGTIITSTSGLSESWISRTSPVSNYITDIIWVPELRIFAASCENVAIITSIDGVTWVSRTLPVANTFRGLAYGDSAGVIVAVAISGSGNRVITSVDGITWISRTSAANYSWYNIAWSSELSLFAAISVSGGTTDRVMTSPTGITWSLRVTPNVDYVNITWSPQLSMFVAINLTGTAGMYSTNGTTWTAFILPINQGYNDIIWNPIYSKFYTISSTTKFSLQSTIDYGYKQLNLGNIYTDQRQNAVDVTIGKTANIININANHVNIYNFKKYYYNSNISSLSISVASTFVTDITIYDVPAGSYIARISINMITNRGLTTIRIIDSSSNVLYTSAQFNPLATGAPPLGVGLLPLSFMCYISSNSLTNISYQITATNTGVILETQQRRFFYLEKVV